VVEADGVSNGDPPPEAHPEAMETEIRTAGRRRRVRDPVAGRRTFTLAPSTSTFGGLNASRQIPLAKLSLRDY
jgi:hypothetical protein